MELDTQEISFSETNGTYALANKQFQEETQDLQYSSEYRFSS